METAGAAALVPSDDVAEVQPLDHFVHQTHGMVGGYPAKNILGIKAWDIGRQCLESYFHTVVISTLKINHLGNNTKKSPACSQAGDNF